jgi:YjbR
MLRPSDFRRIVLGMEGAFEGAHMGHPDFRAHGRIFATLNAEETRGVVMLTPEQQQTFLADHQAMFESAPGAWGRSGSTWVNLDAADEDTIGEAVTLAWQNAAAKAAAKKKPAARKTRPTARKARPVAKKKSAKKTKRRR